MNARIVVTLAVCVSTVAAADCAMPRPFVLPESSVTVPANPTLFLFWSVFELQAEPKLRALNADTQKELPLQLTRLSTTDGFVAWKVQVTAPLKTRFLFKGTPRFESAGVWTTGEVEKASGLVVERGADKSDSWACSYDAYSVLETSIDAPAYRIEFAHDEAALWAGKFEAVVVDGHNGAVSGRKRQPGQVQLGHRSCTGFNFRWTAPKTAVRVTALLSDGTERASQRVFVLDALVLEAR